MVLPVIAATAAVTAAVSWMILSRQASFAPGACSSLERFLQSEIVGQQLAIHQMSDAICDHLLKAQPEKPLVLSVHGPPGVGKSLSHRLLAQAMYDAPGDDLECPGAHCPGYKVLQGMDHINAERAQQHWYLKNSVLTHLRKYTDSILVIEEYDKLDCPTRAILRQLITSSGTANVSMDKSVVILESNLGQLQLHKMLIEAGERSKVTAEEAHNGLRNLVYDIWSQGNCESHVDIIRMLGAIDFFLPFFPLEASNIQELFTKRLAEQSAVLVRADAANLTWSVEVMDFLISKVDFGDCKAHEAGCYPVEGARPVSTIMTRYVTRALKQWRTRQEQERLLHKQQHKAAHPGLQGSVQRRKKALLTRLSRPVRQVQLHVDHDNQALKIV
ncbi:hypothetical protein ABBQ38_005003 [Trebouxia sp. C0009 RCD-2024]